MEEIESKIEMFTAPKPVKKKSPKDIILVQLIVCALFTAILLVFKAFLPELYENISNFINSRILC